jgi:hypothetical protein
MGVSNVSTPCLENMVVTLNAENINSNCLELED